MSYSKKLNDFKKKVIEKIYSIMKIKKEKLNIDFGKMLRSELVFILSEFKTEEKNVRIASIIEIIHNSAIIIDDIVDDETERRGKKPLNKYIGDKKAYLISSIMIIKAIKNIFKNDLIGKAFIKIIERMILSEIDKKNYITTCYNKTGLLFVAPILAIIEKYNYDTLRKIYYILKHIGILYQIKDDIIDKDSNMDEKFLSDKLKYYRNLIEDKIKSLEIKSIKENLKTFIDKIVKA
ncbi:MAG TPA: polyprenyl synthetase family protein [Spirochaetota bacterium]|nr:polyprenyl synthetase family protein [Spirochaetota bacterium]HOM37692.1 polyprenyl synthetase family protein [Spirochaetota bacterium]HPQ49650.1 polyprenyl synthetase family protein [Spirochaetota bacterium]